MLVSEKSFDEVVVKTDYKNLDLICSTMELAGAEIELASTENREYLLKTALKKHMDKYDYIIIDCPPSLNILTVNALTFAESIIVPIQCEFFALEGLTQLLYTIKLVQKNLNPSLYIEGILFTMYDARTNLSNQVIDEVKNNLKENIYKTVIPRNIRLAEAPSYGEPITKYASDSKGAESYRDLAKEVINGGVRK